MKTYRCDMNFTNGDWKSFEIKGHNHKNARRDAYYKAKAIAICNNTKLDLFTLTLKK